jgi:hypothetical protein
MSDSDQRDAPACSPPGSGVADYRSPPAPAAWCEAHAALLADPDAACRRNIRREELSRREEDP